MSILICLNFFYYFHHLLFYCYSSAFGIANSSFVGDGFIDWGGVFTDADASGTKEEEVVTSKGKGAYSLCNSLFVAWLLNNQTNL